MTRAEWLASLKVGDEVGITTHNAALQAVLDALRSKP